MKWHMILPGLALATTAWGTDISGSLGVDTVLDQASSPWHLTGSLTVQSGVTLTIEAGVELLVDGNFDIYVNGVLDVNGTALDPVHIHGNAGTDWRSIRLANASGPCSIEHALIEDGGTNSSYGVIRVDNSTLDLDQVSLQNASYDGLVLGSAADVELDGFSVSGTRYPIHLSSAAVDFDIVGATNLAGNTYDQIRCSYSSVAQDLELDAADVAYVHTGNVTVQGGSTLELGPGLVLKMPWNSNIYVHGGFKSLGSAGSPNWITSQYDDNIAGDSNGDGAATTPAAGNWSRISFQEDADDANCVMNYTTVRFGNSSIYMENADPHFTNCEFTNSHYPMHMTGISAPVITDCNFAVATHTPLYMSLSANPVMSGNDFSTSNNGYDAIGIISETLSANGHLPVRSFTSVPNVTYVMYGNITVPAGISLTIDPGVVIKYRSYYEGMSISGHLDAQGTLADPIVMTSVKDDNYGNPADTNNDGSITAPAAGNWRGIGMLSGATGNLDYVNVRYSGGYWHYSQDNYYRSAGLAMIHCSPSVDNCTFFANGEHGILMFGTCTSSISNSLFQNHTETPIAMSATALPSFSGNSFSNNAYTALGLLGERLGTSVSLPQVTLAGITNITWLLEELLVIDSGTQLSVDPGLVIKMLNTACGINVEGGLDAVGTALDPIVFTSVKDDNYGNPADTNNDANDTLPDRNNWRHLNFLPTSDDPNCQIDHVWLGYGGYSTDGVIRCEASGPSITNTTIQNSQYGISIRGNSTPLVEDCVIQNCYYTPIYMSVTSNPNISFSNLFTNNGYFALGIINEALSTVATLPQRNVAGVNNFTYLFLNAFVIESTGSLTFEEGVVAKFLSYADIQVHGAFHTQGTAANRVFMTSYRDDAVGGDTNDDGSNSSPAVGNWGRVVYYPESDPASLMEQTVVRFGGYTYNSFGQIHLSNCSPTIRDCEITNSYWAFQLDGESNPVIEDNTLVNLNYAPVSISVHANPTFSDNQIFNVGYRALQLQHETVSVDRTIQTRDFAGITNISYVLNNTLSISNTTTLTFAPTLVVKLQNGEVDVNGSLIADNVVFTSLRDDTVGNPLDTEDNGAGTVPGAGNWYGIDFNDISDDGSCLLSNVEVRYASNGVECTNAAPELLNVALSGSTYNLYLNGNSPAQLNNVLFENAATAPVLQSLVTDADYTQCTFDPSNNYNGIYIKSETLAQDIVMRRESSSNVVNLPYILHNLTAGSSSILSIEQGVVIKCLNNSWLGVHKGFQAIGAGAPEDQIVFTHIEDDFYGGDTNGDGGASEPVNGESNFTLYFYSDSWDALCDVEQVVFAWGGSWSRGVIEVQSASPSISGCSFRDCRYGITATGSSNPVIEFCDFWRIDEQAVSNDNPAITLVAENNFWGDPTGPLDSSDDTASGGLYNPGGLGQEVSDYVDYDPWESSVLLPLLGDVSLNGEIHAYDASLILAWLTDPVAYPLAPEQQAVADVTASGGINATDAHYILQYVVGAALTFPGEMTGYNGDPADPATELSSRLEAAGDGNWLLSLDISGEHLLKGFQLEAALNTATLDILDVSLADSQQGSLRWHQQDGHFRLAMAASAGQSGDLSVQILLSGQPDENSFVTQNFTVNDTVFELTETGLEEQGLPMQFQLHPNHPNPFNPVTSISFDLPSPERMSLKVFNLRGQLVRTLQSGLLSAGSHHLMWEGSNSAGRAVSSGVYLLVFEGEKHQAVQRMTLLK